MPHAQANSTLTVVRSAKSNIFFQPLARKNLCHLSAFAFCFLEILTLFASFSQAQDLSFSQALDMASTRATTLQSLYQEEQLARSYFNVQIRGGILRAAQQTLQASTHGLEIARSHYAEGMVSKLDVTRARADLQSARAQVYAAEAQMIKQHLFCKL
jgi:outer membrane protein TolC